MAALHQDHAVQGGQPLARAARRPVLLNGFVFRADGTSCSILLTDLSYDGCGVRCDLRLDPGERVTVSVLDRGGLEAQVQWCRDGRAGLRFDGAGAAVEQVSRRRVQRTLLEAQVHVRRPGSPGYAVRVYDASPEGCRVDALERFRENEPIWVRFPGLDAVEARLCWRDQFTAGLRFVRPIHPAVFGLLLTRLR